MSLTVLIKRLIDSQQSNACVLMLLQELCVLMK